MSPKDDIAIQPADPQSDDAKACLSRYYDELAAAFDTGFDVNLSRDPDADALRPPFGAFFVAYHRGTPVGCVGLKGGPDYAEIKRLWVDPETRGLGIARALMDAAEITAVDYAIPLLRLDTNSALPAAIAMYRKWGWREIPRFNDDPYAELFFEKALDVSTAGSAPSTM